MLLFSNFISYSPCDGAVAAAPTVEFLEGYVAKCLYCVSNREPRLVYPFAAQWQRQIAEELAPRYVHAICKRPTGRPNIANSGVAFYSLPVEDSAPAPLNSIGDTT